MFVRNYLLLVLFFLAGCGGVARETETPADVGAETLLAPALSETALASPTAVPASPESVQPSEPQQLPTATAVVLDILPAATSSVPADDLAISAESVFVYPVPAVYEGDLVTFLVRPAVPAIVDSSAVVVRVDVDENLSLSRSLMTNNLAGSPSALFAWDWDTRGQVGERLVTVTVDPADLIVAGDEDVTNNQVAISIAVLPARARPEREQNAEWLTAETTCCVLHVVSGTAAHRDLNQLRTTVETAVQDAAATLGVTVQDPLHFYLIDRVIGQGGYASSTVVVSYLDRNYVGEGIAELITHEAVHLLDYQFAPNRISFLAEGLAVWVTGGHYKVEDIDQRVQALRETGLYVPLAELADDFYSHQHELAYLQAGGFIQFLVNSYGWDPVRAFYRDVGADQREAPSQMLDAAVQRHFGTTLDAIEREWFAYLDTLPRDPDTVADVLTTIRYYDLMRVYQLKYDPTAHFLQAWLPSARELEERQITADLTRHPDDEVNVTLEVMFHAVDRALRRSSVDEANILLDSLERTLQNDGLFLDPLGLNYSQIVNKLMAVGYDVYQVELQDNRALAQVTEGRQVVLRTVGMLLRNRTWVLLN